MCAAGMAEIVNIAAYQFAPLTQLQTLRGELRDFCQARNLKGTILLAQEGINLFVAGLERDVEDLVARLRLISGLEKIELKYSRSRAQPFRRMLVRIKKEIIAFGVDGIDPARSPARKIAPRELKAWLDEGRPVTLLDTRNDYEVRLGTFRNAIPAGIDHFRQFPDAVRRLEPQLRDAPVVMFCTGGIRCEKAGPFMEQQGFKDVFQLEGGILKYFEQCGSYHYDGECFVFDHRVGLDPALRETTTALCYHCQTPLTVEEQQDPRYRPPDSCPHCHAFVEDELGRIEQALRAVSEPLPGSVPWDNARPLQVPPNYDGASLREMLCGLFPFIETEEWERRLAAGLFYNQAQERCGAEYQVKKGERLVQIETSVCEPDVNAAIAVLHVDEAVIVLNKPAPLPMHPGGRFHRNTLSWLLNQAFAPVHPRPAHRLDANTTGVLVCARTRHIAGVLQPQFARGEVEKCYLVEVPGRVEDFTCDVPISENVGKAGGRVADAKGLPAVTHFSVFKRKSDSTILLARPVTGRTNQIRVHLWHAGTPVIGDPLYLPERQLGTSQTLPLDAPAMRLHAREIGFWHPTSGERIKFCAPAPGWVTDDRRVE